MSGPPIDEHHAALHAALAIAARRPSLFEPEAFDAFADALRDHIRFFRVSVLLKDGPEHERLYAFSRGPALVLPLGARFSVAEHPGALRTFVEGEPYYCLDTRQGNEFERLGALAGYLSYVAVPIKAGPSRSTVAQLLVSFDAVGAAADAPLPLLEEVADILGAHLAAAMNLARERRLAKILDSSTDAMLAWDIAGVVTDANAAAEALTGLGRGELIGASIHDLLVPLPRGATPAHGERLTLRRRAEGGRREPVEVAVTVSPVQGDPLVAAHALVRDLSVIAAAERAAAQHLAQLRELEEQHRTLLDNAPLIIFRLDPRGEALVFLNRHAERLLGVPTAEALRTPGFLRDAHATAEGVAAFEDAVARAREGALSLPYEARLRRRGGGEVKGRGNVYPLLSERGEVVAIEGVLADVSAEHQARTRLVQADRLSTLGTLAAGMAHEINNPAAHITLGLDTLSRMLRSPGVRMEDAEAQSVADMVIALRESVRRIAEIIRNLRMFASPPAPGPSGRVLVDVNAAVEAALTLSRGQIIERAQIVRDLGDVPPAIMDDHRLGQVLVHLLMNAAQGIQRAPAGANTVTIVTRSAGDRVEIAVRDTGAGIRPDDLPRIWEPFFATTPSGLGAGLGLTISREIVERAGGTIHVTSPPEGAPRGVEVVLSLRAAGLPDGVADAEGPLSPSTRRRMRVLVVDDEHALGRAIAEELRAEHVVEEASNGHEALALLAGERFDVVLCDLKMPGMSGMGLYAEAQRLNPAHGRAFVFMTGVGFGDDVERFLAESGRPLLEKPFALEEALDVMRRVASDNRADDG